MAALCDLIEYMYEPVENLNPKPRLCDSCRMINFQRVLAPPDWKERDRWGTWHVHDLGRRGDSSSPTCSLCQLLSEVYYGSPCSTWQLRAMMNWRNNYWQFPLASKSEIYPVIILFTCEREKFHFTERDIRRIERVLFYRERPWPRGGGTKWDIQELHATFLPNFHHYSPFFKRSETTQKRVQAQEHVSVLRLIDCANDDLRVVDADSSMEWVALSYVWSTVKTGSMATPTESPRSTIDIDSSSTSPKNSKASALMSSQLIQDASTVVKGLGYRYLWVDQLCIDQDNLEERHSQIRHMASIYSQAKLTIVAMSDTGYLPGVKEARKPTEIVIRLRDKQRGKILSILKPTPNIVADFKGSLWSTRGWTFQEAMLSRQILYFTDSRVLHDNSFTGSLTGLFTYYGGTQINEDYNEQSREYLKRRDEVRLLLRPSRYEFSKEEVWRFYHALLHLIEEYTDKKLTHPKDILDAIRGILRLFGEPRYIIYSLQGLPCLPNHWIDKNHNTDEQDLLGYSICWSLMWFNTKWEISKNRDSFPSWSWAHWMGKVIWIRNSDLLPYADAATVQEYAEVFAIQGPCGYIKGPDDNALREFWDCAESGKEAKGLYIHTRSISNLMSQLLIGEALVVAAGNSWTIKNIYCHIEGAGATEVGLREKLLSGAYDIVLMMEKRYHGPRLEAYALAIEWDQGSNTSENGIRVARRVGMVVLKASRDEDVLLLWNSPGLSKAISILLM